MITQLFALLGFKIDSGKLSVFQKQVGDTKQKLDNLGKETNKTETSINAFTLTIGACVAGLIKLAQQASETAARLDNFNKRTNISTQALQQWEAVAKQSNVQAESITSAFESIVKARGDLLTGSGNVKAWAILGIDPSQDPNVVFNQLLQQLGKIDDVAVRVKRLSDLGLDPQLVNLVGKSLNDVVGLSSKMLVMSDKEKTSLLSLKKAFVDLGLTLSALVSKFRVVFTPIIFIIDLFTRTVAMIYNILDATGLLNIAIIGLTAYLGYLAIAMLPVSGQFLIMTAIILGVIAVVEDLYTFFTGGDSLIGRFFNTKPLKAFIEDLKIIWDWVVGIGQKVGGWFKGIGSFTKKIFGGNDEKEVAIQRMEQTVQPPATIGRQSTINNNPNITNTFNIDGSKDPKAVANEVASMQEQINTNSLLMESGY